MARFDYRHLQDPPSGTPQGPTNWLVDRPQMPYIIPFFAFVLVMVPGSFGHFAGIDWGRLWKVHLPELYAIKSIIGALLLWYFWPCYTRIRWEKLWLGALVGIAGTVLWIATELFCQHVGLAKPPALPDPSDPADPATLFNPDLMFSAAPHWQMLLFLCIRVAGPTLVVPPMEELFFRDFLMRALVRGAHFQDVAVGTFTWLSLIGMSILFGINHGITNFLLAGIVYGLLMGVLLIRTKSLGACIVAHAVTNCTLYLWVIYTGNWQFM